MSECLGTMNDRVIVQRLAQLFRKNGTQKDLDALKAGIDAFEELVTAPEPEPETTEEPAAEPGQPNLPEGDGDAGQTPEGD